MVFAVAVTASSLSAKSAVAGLSSALSSVSLSRRSRSAKAGLTVPLQQRERGLVIECAHKKGSGSTKNGRDSNSKRLGCKVYGDQPAKAGSIIIRQRGSKIRAGDNVGCGKDYTLYSTVAGTVKFHIKLGKKYVSVVPEDEDAVASEPAPGSRKARKRAMYPPRATLREQAVAAEA